MRTLILIFTLAAGALALAGCIPETDTAAQQADKANKAAQDNVKARATASVPVPPINNFQARENLAEFMRRVDEKGKVWYVYERARNSGDILGFYLSSSYPQSVCTFMTPPEEVKERRVYGSGPNPISVTTAIALDGVYYKGGDCPDFFFDYTTGAMVVLDADAVTIAVDKPLEVAAPKWTFTETKKEPEVLPEDSAAPAAQ